MAEDAPFDPLALENLGVILAVELLRQPLAPLPPASFEGAGVYALYYGGGHPAYRDLVQLDAGRWSYPVYVGQAMASGFSLSVTKQKRIHERLKNHAQSIEEVSNLDLADFRCRYLVINDAHVGLAESVLITAFGPPWNGMGFGSKVVGERRMGQQVSLWDSLHPGRAGRPASNVRSDEAAAKIRKSLDALSVQPDDRRIQWMLDRIRKFL